MRIFGLVIALCTAGLGTGLAAHELWIEPFDYQLNSGGQLQADIVNGENFTGTRQPYIPNRFKHFVLSAGDRTVQVSGRVGDTPALKMTAASDGLHIVGYQSTPSTITYQTWEKFQKFVDHKDFGDVRPRHDARGLPPEGFAETYIRFSKSLIGVGDSVGSDQRIGLETEIVALANPYTDDLSNGLPVQLFYGQNPRSNEQIEVFEKAPGGAVNVFLLRTNDQGIATVPVQTAHAYQLDAVVLREPSDALGAQSNAAWETLWANITFFAP